MAFDPTDDQRCVIKTLDRPLFVSAGAGSGKSSTLAERVAWAFKPGSGADGKPYLDDIGQVLIITFTHAAADEIKDKVRSRLREAGLVDQALAVDGAWISTIHSMCARIIRRHAFELGVDPQFRMATVIEQDAMREAACEEVVRRIEEEMPYPELTSLIPMHSKSSRSSYSVTDMAMKLTSAAANSSRGFGSIVIPGELADPVDMLADFRSLLGTWIATVSADEKLMQKQCASEDVIRLSEDCERIDALLCSAESSDVDAIARLVGSMKAPRKNYGSSEIKDLSVEVCGDFAMLRLGIYLSMADKPTKELLEVARAIDAVYSELKSERGVLDNDDLVALGLAALRDHPDIASEYINRFKLVMVDEFQDTNAQQVELVKLLSGEGACHLATVGDAQQSIYRFRAADVEVFLDREKSMPKESVIRLDVNFRSHPDILAFVAHALGQGVLDGFMPLAPCSEREDKYHARALPRCTVELVQATKGKHKPANSSQRSIVLAARIARRLAAFREAGESPDDMVLLLGRMANLGIYLQALRSVGLDCVVSGGSLFTACEEVGVIASLLDFLADPHDTENGLFPVLTSEMFGIDADDLVALATKVQETNGALAKRGIDVGLMDFGFVEGVEPSPKLVAAHQVLQRAVTRSATWKTTDVLLAACRESGWLARLESGDAEARGRLANVLAAIRHVGEIADEGKLGLARTAREFRHWLSVAKEGPASLSGAVGGAVRVMTVHASKGLEFPIVAVVDCWGSRPEGASGLLAENIAGVTHAVVIPKDVESSDLKSRVPETVVECKTRAEWACYLYNRSTTGDEAEEARLLYVALTRAREAVVLGLSFPAVKKDPGDGKLMKSVIRSLYPSGLPEVGVSKSTYDYVYPEEAEHDSKDEAHEKHSAVTYRTDINTVDLPSASGIPGATDVGYELDCGGCDPSFAGVHRDLLALLAAGGTGEDSSFTLYDQAPADGLAEVASGVRPWKSRSDVFSYSSIRMQAMREADSARSTKAPAMAEEDRSEGDDAELAPEPADADRATDLGSAFHELAQSMIETGQLPTAERIEATSEVWGLRARQRERLGRAIKRWEESDIRVEALSHELVQAEVPFFVPVADSDLGSYVEGYIDLLARDAGSDSALVVDYKTGDAKLSAEELRANHEMQANFYAWVLMRQGMQSVECAFVCVERDAGDGQPEVVRYSFDATHPPRLG